MSSCTPDITPPTPAAQVASDEEMTVEYEKPSADYADEQSFLRESGVLERWTEDTNSFLVMPVSLPTVLIECGEANAFYDSESQRIEICYELVEDYRDMYSDQEMPPEDVDRMVAGSLAETYLHELGHALIDVLELPITGPEEAAADAFAAYWLINSEGGAEVALDASESYRIAADSTALEELPFHDEHALDIQRHTTLLCYVYGSDEQQFGYLVEDGHLPADRGESCASEYSELEFGWSTLLDPHWQK